MLLWWHFTCTWPCEPWGRPYLTQLGLPGAQRSDRGAGFQWSCACDCRMWFLKNSHIVASFDVAISLSNGSNVPLISEIDTETKPWGSPTASVCTSTLTSLTSWGHLSEPPRAAGAGRDFLWRHAWISSTARPQVGGFSESRPYCTHCWHTLNQKHLSELLVWNASFVHKQSSKNDRFVWEIWGEKPPWRNFLWPCSMRLKVLKFSEFWCSSNSKNEGISRLRQQCSVEIKPPLPVLGLAGCHGRKMENCRYTEVINLRFPHCGIASLAQVSTMGLCPLLWKEEPRPNKPT